MAAADAAQKVRDGRVDVALLRFLADTSGLAVIPLYEEVTVAVVAVGHLLTAADEITAADLEGEPVLLPLDDVVGWAARPGILIEHRPETTEAAIELVAAGLVYWSFLKSLARLFRRRDVTYRPIARRARKSPLRWPSPTARNRHWWRTSLASCGAASPVHRADEANRRPSAPRGKGIRQARPPAPRGEDRSQDGQTLTRSWWESGIAAAFLPRVSMEKSNAASPGHR